MAVVWVMWLWAVGWVVSGVVGEEAQIFVDEVGDLHLEAASTNSSRVWLGSTDLGQELATLRAAVDELRVENARLRAEQVALRQAARMTGSWWFRHLYDQGSIPIHAIYDGNMGFAVAAAGNLVAVSAPKNNIAAANAGLVHVYRRYPDGSFSLMVNLFPPNAQVGDEMGFALAMDTRVLIVGARTDRQLENNGAFWVFAISNDGTSLDSNPLQFVEGPLSIGLNFGRSLSLSGDLLVVGARCDPDNLPPPDCLFLYHRGSSGDNFVFVKALSASAFPSSRTLLVSLALSGTRLAVATLSETPGNSLDGAAYIFHLDTTVLANASLTWQATLSSDEPNDLFGRSLCFVNEILLIGAPAQGDHVGRILAYAPSSSNGDGLEAPYGYVGELANPGQMDFARFGMAMSTHLDTLYVSSFQRHPNGTMSDTGHIHIFYP